MNIMTNTSSVRARREAALRQANIAAGFHNLVDGQRLAATQTLDVIDPATGEILAKVPDVDRRDLDAAVEAAARAFPSWSRTPWDVRKAAVGRESPAGDEGLFFPITILDNPRYDAPYVTQENFGPLRSIMRYRTVGEAIQKANDTPYGLGASVWGRDPAMLDAVARRLEAGTVWINQHLNPHPDVPFVELGPEGLRDFCNLQSIAARQ